MARIRDQLPLRLQMLLNYVDIILFQGKYYILNYVTPGEYNYVNGVLMYKFYNV